MTEVNIGYYSAYACPGSGRFHVPEEITMRLYGRDVEVSACEYCGDRLMRDDYGGYFAPTILFPRKLVIRERML